MDLSLDFSTYTLWSVYGTIAFFLLAILGFIFQWGFRFRFVGVTGFMAVLTVGLFALSLGLFERVEIPNALRYNLVYDTGTNQAVIAVEEDITKTELEATLQQAAIDLFSYGRTASNGDDQLTIRARVQIHKENTTYPLYLGQIRRSLITREDDNLEITIFQDSLRKRQSLINLS
ncbi:Ycf51 family protein [Cyanobacterium aponinum AL20118]|uniref:Ycf51 family protein n=1 Tax=Cyanobacterium aponinum AL20115 TaxID=3090662 RepID=A0AAF1C152_9CHRO|nr:Ycf51 family protein [Cyanobacterium aponinum]WPF88282.1 Ycf51 family protein [Cyanobacterium aponinum AL20115]